MKTDSKKILILGMGSAQADAIRCAKRLGCEVHAVANKLAGPGMAYADHVEAVNIVDMDGVLDYASNVGFDAVYSVGSDIAMPTVGYVAERLGLACPVTRATAELLNHKGRFRAMLVDRGLWTLKHAVARSASDVKDWNTFPAIVKPVDSQGGRGVAVAQKPGDFEYLVDHAVSFSRDGKAIVEEYVTGPEFSIDAFLRDGELVLGFVSDRFVDMAYPCGVVVGHGMPARVPRVVQKKALALAAKAARAAGIADGPAYFQLKHVGDKVHLIEATPRLDGCHIWRLIDQMYGVDLLEASLRVALGEDVKIQDDPVPKHDALNLEFFVQKPGTPFHEQSVSPEALFSEWFFADGEPVRRINGYAEKTGYQIRPS